MRLKSLLKPAVLATLVASCSAPRAGESVSQVTEDADGLNRLKPSLGAGFNAYTDEYLGDPCLDLSQLGAGDYMVVPPNMGDMVYSHELDYDEVRNTIKGNADVKIDMDSLDVNGELAIENDAASNDLAVSVSIISHASEGRYAIKDAAKAKIRLSEFGKSVRDNPDLNSKMRAQRCGTNYLTGFELAATFVATVRFEFGSQSDRDHFFGKIGLIVSTIQANGQLDVTQLDVSNRAKVSMTFHQMGGDATRIGANLKEDVSTCSATNPAACIRAIDGFRQYVAEDFPKQFVHADDQAGTGTINPYAYFIRNPSFGKISGVDPTFDGVVPSPEERIVMNERRRTLNDKFIEELRDKNRVRAIKDSGLVKSIAQRNALVAMQETFDDRMRVIAKAIKPCYEMADDIAKCDRAVDEYKEKIAAYPVDYSLMQILPQSFEDYCGQLKVWHTTYFGDQIDGNASTSPGNPNAAELDMDRAIRHTVVAMLNIEPIKTAQDGKDFTADLANDTAAVWTPAGKETRADGSPYWNCPRLGETISYMSSPVALVDKKLHNIEPVATFADVEDLDLSDNRIQAGIAAIGKLQYLRSFKATGSRIKNLKGIGNDSLVKLDLSHNLIPSAELAHLVNMPKLEQLILSGNDGIRNLDDLVAFPKLKQLVVRQTAVEKDAMRRFLMERYGKLGGKPEVFWDTDACVELQVEDVPNAGKLVCAD